MKKLSFGNKIVYFLNSFFAVLLILSYVIPYVKPNYFPVISALSLLVPVLLIINTLFFIYWLLGFKKQFFLSLVSLILGFNYATSFYKLHSKEILSSPSTGIMSYNVRLFNVYNWIKDKNTENNLVDFIKKQHPDILCLQEYRNQKQLEELYLYKYIFYKDSINHFGQAIFSDYPIINKVSLNFSNTSNNAIYADIVKNNDTIRVFNIHLESLHLNPKKDKLNEKNSRHILKNIGKSFAKQQKQVIAIKNTLKNTLYKTVICADLNNTAFSWSYRALKSNFNDAFAEAGSGFGTTFKYNYLALRIDFILIDKSLNVLSFKDYKVNYSDHKPIKANIAF